MELKIAKLKKAEGEIKLYEEETISKIKREMLSFMRREPQDQEGKVEDMCKELVSFFPNSFKKKILQFNMINIKKKLFALHLRMWECSGINLN